MAFPNLFGPLQLGSIELPNRIVHVPTDISSSHADGDGPVHHAPVDAGGH